MQTDVTARITGSGSFLPPTTLDNFELYELESIRSVFDVERARASLRGVDAVQDLTAAEVFDEWARQVTGIRERRVLAWDSDDTTERMCAEATRRALESAGTAGSDLDLLLVASLTGAEEVPNEACTIANMLGVPELGGFTMNVACAGFVYAVATANAFIRSGLAETVAVVSGEALSRITCYSDPKTAVLFGDGAGAVILTASTDGDGILGTPFLGASYNRDPLHMVGQGWEKEDGPGATLHMDGGPRILRRAIVNMTEIADQTLASAGRGWDDVDLVIPHQANLRITRGIEKQLNLSKGRVLHIIQRYGNMSASTVAVALDEALRGAHGPLPDPALIVLTAIGGGYTSAAAVIEHRGGVAARGSQSAAHGDRGTTSTESPSS